VGMKRFLFLDRAVSNAPSRLHSLEDFRDPMSSSDRLCAKRSGDTARRSGASHLIRMPTVMDAWYLLRRKLEPRDYHCVAALRVAVRHKRNHRVVGAQRPPELASLPSDMLHVGLILQKLLVAATSPGDIRLSSNLNLVESVLLPTSPLDMEGVRNGSAPLLRNVLSNLFVNLRRGTLPIEHMLHVNVGRIRIESVSSPKDSSPRLVALWTTLPLTKTTPLFLPNLFEDVTHSYKQIVLVASCVRLANHIAEVHRTNARGESQDRARRTQPLTLKDQKCSLPLGLDVPILTKCTIDVCLYPTTMLPTGIESGVQVWTVTSAKDTMRTTFMN
ncbi:hypothetical protein LTR04_002335, partial [Oleoguttula sp. CCFEE 6159]